MSLWPFVVYLKGYGTHSSRRAHEEYHWRQALRWGVVPCYLTCLATVPFCLRKPWRHQMKVLAQEMRKNVKERLE